jgi:hypothetical protein
LPKSVGRENKIDKARPLSYHPEKSRDVIPRDKVINSLSDGVKDTGQESYDYRYFNELQ